MPNTDPTDDPTYKPLEFWFPYPSEILLQATLIPLNLNLNPNNYTIYKLDNLDNLDELDENNQ